MDKNQIDEVEFDGVDGGDYPDFSDAYICRATWKDGTELTEEELEKLSEDGTWVYEKLISQLF